MKSKKIIVAALVAVAAIVLAGCSPRSSMATLSTDSDSETAEVFSLAKVLNLGTNYLTSLDYDNAILQYIDTKLGFPCPRRFRSIRPNFSSSRSSLVALLSAQHNALLTSSIVKMMNTRPCSSSQPFLADRLMRSSRIPYSVLASVDRFWKRDSKKSAFGMR